MKIGDVLSLYTHGYTKEQIGIIKDVYEKDESILEAAKEVKSFDELSSLIELANEPGEPQEENVSNPQPESAAETEQKAELEALKKDKTELEEQVRKMQETNAARDVSGNQPSPEDTVTELFRNSI